MAASFRKLCVLVLRTPWSAGGTLFSVSPSTSGVSNRFHKGPRGCRFSFQPIKHTQFDQSAI